MDASSRNCTNFLSVGDDSRIHDIDLDMRGILRAVEFRSSIREDLSSLCDMKQGKVEQYRFVFATRNSCHVSPMALFRESTSDTSPRPVQEIQPTLSVGPFV